MFLKKVNPYRAALPFSGKQRSVQRLHETHHYDKKWKRKQNQKGCKTLLGRDPVRTGLTGARRLPPGRRCRWGVTPPAPATPPRRPPLHQQTSPFPAPRPRPPPCTPRELTGAADASLATRPPLTVRRRGEGAERAGRLPPPPRPRRARRTPALRRPRCPPPPTPPRPRTHILTPLALPPPLSVAAVVAAAAASSSCGGCCCGGGCGCCCCCCCGGGWLAAAASSVPRCGAAAAASGLSFSAISWPGRGPATAGFEKGPERLGLAAPGRPSLARTGLAAGRGRAGRLCALPW